MAKSARASRLKSNKTRLRHKVFGPVVDARTERLSQKLLELASQPKPETEKPQMDLDDGKAEATTSTTNEAAASAEDMDLDDGVASGTGERKQKSKKNGGRIHKKRHRKVQNAMTFPAVKQRRTVSRVSKRK